MATAYRMQRLAAESSGSIEIVRSELQENHKLILLLTQMSSFEKILSGLAILITIL